MADQLVAIGWALFLGTLLAAAVAIGRLAARFFLRASSDRAARR